MSKTTRTQRMELAKKHGTVTFKGTKYWLTKDAYVDNYGTDGEVRYYSKAIDRKGNEYRVSWDTTAEFDAWNRQAQLVMLINSKKQYNDDYTEFQTELDASIAKYGDGSDACEDESNACDWDNPENVEAI